MAINLELAEQELVFDEGSVNRFYHPMRCVIAGKKNDSIF